jgi:hypothetical protein
VTDELHTLDEEVFGDVISIDSAARTIDIKKRMRFDTFHPRAVFAYKPYGSEERSNSILRIADWIIANGMESPGEYRAARDLLLRNPPRLSSGQSLAASEGESVLQAACRLGVTLDRSVLPIQGPPGAGKTYTGAHMICELIMQGKKVGITAISHKVIRFSTMCSLQPAKQTSTRSRAGTEMILAIRRVPRPPLWKGKE